MQTALSSSPSAAPTLWTADKLIYRKIWVFAASAVSILYLVAAQALIGVEGWSSIGAGLAALLGVIVVMGWALGICRPTLGRWVWVPLIFVVFCLVRSFAGIAYTKPVDVLSALISTYLGGIMVAAALEGGVSFKAIVYGQVLSFVVQFIIIMAGAGPNPIPGYDRYQGSTGNANELGLQLTLGACLIWLLPKRSGAIPCAAALGAIALAISTTGSRQAFLASACFLLLVIFQTAAALKKNWVLLSAVFLGLAGLIVAFGVPWLMTKGKDVTAIHRTMDFEDSSFRLRMDMSQKAIQLWKQAPVVGNGLDAFRGLGGFSTYAHNNYVEILCDLGLLGTVLFYGMHLYILANAVRLRGAFRLACVLFLLLILALDSGCVSYKRKQTIMILMVLMSFTSNPRLVQLGSSGNDDVRKKLPAGGSGASGLPPLWPKISPKTAN